jgi:hypothetical protein
LRRHRPVRFDDADSSPDRRVVAARRAGRALAYGLHRARPMTLYLRLLAIGLGIGLTMQMTVLIPK